MKKEGIGGRRNLKEEMKSFATLCKVMQGEHVEIKKRKERKKETEPRKQEEALLRKEVIKALRKIGCRVSRVENSITGKNNSGLGDLWVFSEIYRKAGWMELKSKKGVLTGQQPKVQRLCKICGINYWVVRSVDEAINAIKCKKNN